MQRKSKLKIKEMEKQELDFVLEIEEQAYGEHHWSKDSFYAELSNNLAHYYSAYNENNELIAFAGAWVVLDEAHITTIAVNPKFQGEKIGESLLNHIIKMCYQSDVKYITLEVRVSNQKAISLYEKYGFKSLGTRKGYYQNNNEDALIMWTENIFWDKFRKLFAQNNDLLEQVVSKVL